MTEASIESASDFAQTPQGMQERWQQELTAAKKAASKWQKAGDRITKIFLDERADQQDNLRGRRLNIFSANVITLRSMMFGNVPKAEVSRRFDDANDDTARVAAEMLERIANADVGKQFSYAIGNALDDRLLVGFGIGRVAYEAQFENVHHEAIMGPDGAGGYIELAPAYDVEKKTSEAAPVYYINWRDVLWNPARTWDEVRWVGFRSYLTKDQCTRRFGEKIAGAMNYAKSKQRGNERGRAEGDPWQKAEVWEIWCIEDKAVYWLVEGMDVICDAKSDPLGLVGFYPCPQFLLANPTSKSYTPRADYILAQDQYEEVNDVTTRITMLEKAVKVVGVYDKQADGVQRMMNEAVHNELIPVDNWAAFAERGGIKGQVDWLPIEQVVAALQVLRDYRSELVTLLYQVTGMSDILRGSTQAGETATAQSIKAKFASVRVQVQQDEFARFATDLQTLRCEIIAKHFDDASIVKESNMQHSHDAQMIPQALQLIREFDQFRIAIKSETLAAQDMAQVQSERTNALGGIAQFMQATEKFVGTFPDMKPVMLETLKWFVSGFRNAGALESMIDAAVAKQQQQPAAPPPDPAAIEQQKQQAKTQGAIAVEGAKAQAKSREIVEQARADIAVVGAESQAARRENVAAFAFEAADAQRADAQRWPPQ